MIKGKKARGWDGTDLAAMLPNSARRHALRHSAVLTAALLAAWTAFAGRGEESLAPLPAGTVLWLRLDTAVSTTTSKLRQQVAAHVAREVREGDGVVVPLGTPVTGEIAKLIPSSSPDDRARLLIQFTRISPAGQTAETLVAHVRKVDNARETVLADGTIRGLLASEVPLSRLDGVLGKLGQSDPALGTQIEQAASRNLGKLDTSIALPVGTTIELVLDQPLAVSGVFSPAAPNLNDQALGAVARLLENAPQRAQTKDGKPGDPLNLVVIGSAEQIREAFQKAGWFPAEEKSGNSIWKTITAMTGDTGYNQAPVSQLYLFGRQEDMAFERVMNTFTKRHHLRLWQTTTTAPGGQLIWLGAATHDIGIDIHPGVVSHATDPDLDDERSEVGADLELSGRVAAEQLVTRPNPLSQGLTGTGGAWHTDGRLMAIELK